LTKNGARRPSRTTILPLFSAFVKGFDKKNKGFLAKTLKLLRFLGCFRGIL
jgi:hypothetical protein